MVKDAQAPRRRRDGHQPAHDPQPLLEGYRFWEAHDETEHLVDTTPQDKASWAGRFTDDEEESATLVDIRR
ncbi:MAG: hypothetical protein U0703_08755 [Anaerolineae bacterium]